MKPLTDEQAEAIYTLHREEGFQVCELFSPKDVFGEQPNLERACWEMAGNLLERASAHGYLILTRRALEAYDARARGGLRMLEERR